MVYCSHLDLGNRFRLGYNQVATATLLLVLSLRNLYWQASVVLTGELEKDGGLSLDNCVFERSNRIVNHETRSAQHIDS